MHLIKVNNNVMSKYLKILDHLINEANEDEDVSS